ncbi:MAG: extracellular solute-binding protein [Acidobacteriales bacterium]|nr:extracellular solute-binding protein [Terriglobales bacterium]
MPERLRVALVGGPMYDHLYETIPAWEKASGYEVEIAVKLPHPALNERLRSEFESGALRYDLISTHTKYAPSQADFLLPLDPYITSEELSAFAPKMVELARVDGRLLGVPRNIDVKLLYYRRDLFEDPEEKRSFLCRFGRQLRVPGTWNELLETATHFNRPPGLYGFVFPGRYSGLFGHFFELHAMAGGTLLDHELRAAFNDEAGLWTLRFLAELYAKASAPQVPDWHYDEVTKCFLDGRSAMTTDWPSGYHLYTNPATSKVAGKFGVALYPVGTCGRRFVYSGGFTFAIPTSVRHLDAALSLLRWLVSAGCQEVEMRNGAISARTEVHRKAAASAAPGSQEAARLELLGQVIANDMLLPPRLKEYPEIEEVLWSTIQCAFTGRMSPEDALSRAAAEVNRIMDTSSSGRGRTGRP